jgi:hypothetical protein
MRLMDRWRNRRQLAAARNSRPGEARRELAVFTINKKGRCFTVTHMLRVAVVLLLVVTACAQQCVPFKATPTAGMCKDYTMNGVQCTSSSYPTSGNISARTVDDFNAMNADKCLKQYERDTTCTSLGGKTSPDWCKTGGNYCKMSAAPGCKTDAHCAVGAERPVVCCSAYRFYISLFCTGVNSSAMDTYISQAKKESVNSRSGVACRDTDCLDWNSASSLCTTPILLSAVTLLAISIPFFGQR